MSHSRVTIVGVGLLGGSLGLAIRLAMPDAEIVGFGHRPSTIERAIACGAIHRGEPNLRRAVDGADLVILCTPVGLFEDLMEQFAPGLKTGAIVTDVGSTKRSIVRLAERLLPKGVHFVGSHPMAGSEKRGVEFARADLFRGNVCILTPASHTEPAALRSVANFWTLLGMTIRQISPEEHDQRLAEVSHLPHAVAAALVTMQDDESLQLLGKGFLDATRISAGDGALWRDIFLDNRDNVHAAIGKLRATLDHLDSLLTDDNSDALRLWLDSAAQRRSQL